MAHEREIQAPAREHGDRHDAHLIAGSFDSDAHPAAGSFDSPEIEDLVRRLAFSFPDFDMHRLRTIAREAFEHFRDARVRAFLPSLTERRARHACREVLDALRDEGPGDPDIGFPA
jgi:hypothetical protein